MLWGQSYVLPMTWGVGDIWGAPFGKHAALWLFHFFCWTKVHFVGPLIALILDLM